MWPLQSVITTTPVQSRTLMTEYVRQNNVQICDENLSRVNNKEITAGWRHCYRPLNNNFVQVFIQNKTRNQNIFLNKDLFKVNSRTPVQGMKTRATRTPERHQAALKFQHFLPRQIKCWSNYMKYILPRHFLGNVFTKAGRILYEEPWYKPWQPGRNFNEK